MGVESGHMQRDNAKLRPNSPQIGGGLGSCSVSTVERAFFWSLSMCSNNTAAMAKLIGCKVRC